MRRPQFTIGRLMAVIAIVGVCVGAAVAAWPYLRDDEVLGLAVALPFIVLMMFAAWIGVTLCICLAAAPFVALGYRLIWLAWGGRSGGAVCPPAPEECTVGVGTGKEPTV